MVAQVLTAVAQSSHSLQSVESHIKRLFQGIEVLVNEKKYTAEVNKKIGKIEAEIETTKLAIDHCQAILRLPPGSWVRNGTTKPGKVVDLVIAGRVPEVHVQWHGATVSVPESPAKLALLSPDLVEYVWNGDRYPKLIKIIDGWECDEINILETRLTESIENKEDPDRRFKLAYCKKRIELIDREDLIDLEKAVRQGLQVFYRVGEALAEIRDRQSEAWLKAVETAPSANPTAAHTKAVVAEIINSSDNGAFFVCRVLSIPQGYNVKLHTQKPTIRRGWDLNPR